MQRRLLIGLLLMLWLTLPTLAQTSPDSAQDETDSATERALPPIAVTDIELTLADDGNIQATVSGEPTHPSRDPLPTEGCSMPPGAPIDHLLYRENNVILLDVFSAVPVGEPFCPTTPNYQETFTLPGEFVPGVTYLLRVNDVAVSFDPQTLTDDPTQDDGLFPPPNAPDMLLSAFPVALETIEVVAGDANPTVWLRLRGEIDGCNVSTYALTRPDFVAGDAVTHVEVFRALSPAMACPAVMRFYDETLETNLPADENHVLMIDGQYYRYMADTQTLQAVRRVDMVINEVQKTMTDDALELAIRGYQPDGCEAAIQTHTHISENAVHVALYRLLPVDAACTEIITDYETTLTLDDAAAENLPVVINGEQFPPVQNR